MADTTAEPVGFLVTARRSGPYCTVGRFSSYVRDHARKKDMHKAADRTKLLVINDSPDF